MKIVTSLIYATVALTILSACSTVGVNTQCEKPTLDPPGGSGPTNQDVRVFIKTSTIGAYLSWSDNPNAPPTPTGPHIIQAQQGYGITVFGRTMRAMAFKSGMTNSEIATGVYVGQ
jgi:hypothetical protein